MKLKKEEKTQEITRGHLFLPNQLVLLHKDKAAQRNALSPRKSGPYRVVATFSRGAQLQNCRTGKLRSAHYRFISHLRPGDTDFLLPANFLQEVRNLALDLTKRYHKPKDGALTRHEDTKPHVDAGGIEKEVNPGKKQKEKKNCSEGEPPTKTENSTEEIEDGTELRGDVPITDWSRIVERNIIQEEEDPELELGDRRLTRGRRKELEEKRIQQRQK